MVCIHNTHMDIHNIIVNAQTTESCGLCDSHQSSTTCACLANDQVAVVDQDYTACPVLLAATGWGSPGGKPHSASPARRQRRRSIFVHAAGCADHHVHASRQDAGVLTHTGATHAGVTLDLRG
jgi:hypothetical protein